MSRLSYRSAWLFSLVSIGVVPQLHGQTDGRPTVKFFGDFRLRYENTANQELTGTEPPDINRARNRGVVRFRAGATMAINGLLTFGGRLATGDSDDPNTTDATLGAFVDDIEISLDQVYLALKYRDVFFTGGKFANPFLKTELVWDGDVNPQGIAGSYTFSGANGVTPTVAGMYAIVDEQTLGPDSYTWGGQLQLAIQAAPEWTLTLAGGYYDHKIASLRNASAGDVGSNNLNADVTGYVSDFDLLDGIAMLDYRGSERYPVRFVGDFVKNLGAEVDEDTGFTLDLYVGRASQKHDRRFQYGYSQAETDAVLAAFSHDNTTLSTNYQQHTVGIDYIPIEHTTLTLTWYLHRRKSVAPGAEREFISRLRLNAMVSF